jgi:hypothetical protein
MTEPQRFFVVHLQKTAGTTLRDRFRATLPDSAIYPNATDGDPLHSVISLGHLLERWPTRRDELRLIAGHFPLSTVELLDAPFVTLSVLRPVVDRTLSYLRHQKKVVAADRHRSLEEIYDDPFRFEGLIRNHMTRMFSIAPDEMRAGDGALTAVPDTPERLERAKAGVASLDHLGLQPRFEEFWTDLAAVHDLDPHAAVVSNTTDDEPAPEGLVERIREDNALDIELYEFAEQLYDARSGAAGHHPVEGNV